MPFAYRYRATLVTLKVDYLFRAPRGHDSIAAELRLILLRVNHANVHIVNK